MSTPRSLPTNPRQPLTTTATIPIPRARPRRSHSLAGARRRRRPAGSMSTGWRSGLTRPILEPRVCGWAAPSVGRPSCPSVAAWRDGLVGWGRAGASAGGGARGGGGLAGWGAGGVAVVAACRLSRGVVATTRLSGAPVVAIPRGRTTLGAARGCSGQTTLGP